MAVPTRFGVLAAGGSSFAYVNSSTVQINSTSQSVALPAGAQAGDICFVCLVSYSADTISVSSGSGGAWTKNTVFMANNNYYGSLVYRVLTAGDIGSNITIGSANGASSCTVSLYRGATAVAVKTASSSSGGNDVSLTGFTKSGSCKGIVTWAVGRDSANNPSPPGTFTTRAGPGNYNFFLCETADITNPSNYVNGTTVTWTGVGATDNAGWLVELT